MAGVLCASMLISTGTPAMQVRAVEAGDAEWEKISGIMDTFADKAVWTDTKYSNAISQRMPSTAILGNGDIRATSYGNATEKTWLLSSNNFGRTIRFTLAMWADRPRSLPGVASPYRPQRASIHTTWHTMPRLLPAHRPGITGHR